MAANTYTVSAAGFPNGGGVKTLDGTLADTVTISPLSAYWAVEILNVGSTAIDFTANDAAAVAGAAGTVRIPAGGGSPPFRASYIPGGKLSIVSAASGGSYQVNVWPLS